MIGANGSELPFCDYEQELVILPIDEDTRSVASKAVRSCVDGEYAHIEVSGKRLTALRVGPYAILYQSQGSDDLTAQYRARAHLQDCLVLSIEALTEPFSASRVSRGTATRALRVKDAYIAPAPSQRERLIQLRRQLPGSSEEEFANIIAEGIGIGKGDVVTEQGPGGDLFDFGVWSEALLPIVGNPLLVEVRRSIPTDAVELNRRILRQLAMSGLNWALLIYEVSPSDTTLATFRSPPILPIRGSELLGKLLDVPFDEVIRRCRESALEGQSR